MKVYVCKKKDGTGFEIIKSNSTSGLNIIGESPVDPQSGNPVTDISLLNIARYYVDDDGVRHNVSENALIPSRVVQINKDLPTPPLLVDRQYDERREIVINNSAAQNFYVDQITQYKQATIAKILASCDSKIDVLVTGYSQREVNSWPLKKQLAVDWLALSNSEKIASVTSPNYSLLVNEAGGSDNTNKIINTTALATKVLQLAAIFESYVGSCVKVKKDARNAVTAITTTNFTEAKNECDSIYSAIVWPSINIS